MHGLDRLVHRQRCLRQPDHLVTNNINVVGMRRRGLSKADIHGVRAAYRDLFFGEGEFRARIEKVATDYASNALVGRMFEFIRAGKRPLTMAINRGEADTDA